jgi:lipopolysaccharide export system protein LptA
MRVGRDGIASLLVLLLCSIAPLRAEDAPAAATSTRPNAFFSGLSLGSGKGPVRIDSDSLELDYKASMVTYTGNVHVAQGDVNMTSDKLSITYDPNAVRRPDQAEAPKPKSAAGNDAERIKQIVAEGNVKIRQGNRLAEGQRAVFDQAKQTVVLSDGAVLHDGPNQVAGERVIVYLQEERSVVESGSRSRVKAVLYPGKDDAKATASPAPQQAAEAHP